MAAALSSLALVAAVAAVPTASAKGPTYSAHLTVPSSAGPHSPKVSFVSGFGRYVSISSYGAGPLSATYEGRGRTSRRGVVGDIGRFGSVDLRFEAEGKPKTMPRPRRCSGGPRTWTRWEGTFSGSIRYRPDAGFERIVLPHARIEGSLETVPKWNCDGTSPPQEPHFDPGEDGVLVGASDCDGRSFSASGERHPPAAGGGAERVIDFSAAWTKPASDAQVTYFVSAIGDHDSFLFDEALTVGTLRPPPPFHGEATLARGPDGRWTLTGDLSARFPGHTARLAGAAFETFVDTYRPKPGTAYAFSVAFGCEGPERGR